MDDKELLPCPFCGGSVEIESASGDLGYTPNKLFIKCCHCYLSEIEDTTPIFRKEDIERIGKQNDKITKQASKKLTDRWNTRTEGNK